MHCFKFFWGNMKHSTRFVAGFLVSFLMSMSVWGQQGFSQFYYEESNAISLQQRYAAAPSGSWEEGQYRQQRDQAIQRAVYSINSYTFQGMYYTQIEDFADQMNQKYAAAPSGSAIEGMYRQVRDVSYQAFNQALQDYVLRFSNDWRQINDLAMQMDQKYAAAPSGSQKERAYDQARRALYQRIPQAVDQEMQRMWNFRDVENYAAYFSQQYAAAPSGSLKENVYNQVRRSAYSQAQAKFSLQAYNLSQQELWQIQEEYNRKFSAAPSGSLQESYFRQIRDQARSLIRN